MIKFPPTDYYFVGVTEEGKSVCGDLLHTVNGVVIRADKDYPVVSIRCVSMTNPDNRFEMCRAELCAMCKDNYTADCENCKWKKNC